MHMSSCGLNERQVSLASRENWLSLKRKIEKVPRGIQGEKSSKDMASSRNLVSITGAQASPNMGTEPKTRPKFIDSQIFYFHFHSKSLCSEAAHLS